MPILTNHQTNTLGKNDDTDLLTFTSGELDVAGTVDATNFKVSGAQGTDGQVLTSTGSGVGWEDAGGGGGFTSITRSGKTADYTIVAGDAGKVIEHTDNDITLTLTAAATLGDGFHVWVKNLAGTGDVTSFAFNGSEHMDGRTTDKLYCGESFHIYCDGSNFKILDDDRGISTNIGDDYSPRPTASGDRSTAMGIGSNATGSQSTAIGYYATASGTYSTSIGLENNVSGNNSVGLGNSNSVSGSSGVGIGYDNIVSYNYGFAFGYNNQASANYSSCFGVRTRTRTKGEHSFGSGTLNSIGYVQGNIQMLQAGTTDATQTTLTSSTHYASADTVSSDNVFLIPQYYGKTFTGMIIAKGTASSEKVRGWKFEGVAFRGANASDTELLGSSVTDLYNKNASSWAVALAVNTTRGSIDVKVTGEASTHIHWVCRIDSAQIFHQT